MSRKAKIIWTVTEQADWYAAFIAALKERDVAFPVTQSDLKKIMEAAREALKVLKVERRRDITSIDSIRGDLAERLIGNGIFPRNYLTELRRPGSKAAAGATGKEDPQARRIAELEEHVKALEDERDGLLLEKGDFIERIAVLDRRPTATESIQLFVAETLAMALDLHEQGKRPEALRIPREKAEIPDFERERRRDPVAAAGGGLNGGKPKFALVADFVGSDKAAIHSACSGVADLRYLDGHGKLSGLKVFNANGGRIVVWTNYCPHDWEQSLTSMGVSFHRHRGTLPQLIEHIKGKAK